MGDLTPQQHEQVEELFGRALDLSAAQRAALLDASCTDPAVRDEVESLFAARPAAQRMMNQPLAASGLAAEALRQLSAQPNSTGALAEDPSQIGPYRILSKLGEGGMGSVYLAEQTEPLRRRVAIKLIKLGMDTRSVIRRFDTERQALALMNHPHVARALDAGATAQGRPYFVMEFVDGIRITEFCDQRRLDTAQRLVVFLQACAAIQHAHQKGVIHRDIKPSNVLVAHENGTPAVKVIDFGVAKATNQRLTEQTLSTEPGLLIGTPEYMSPEQADPTAADIDTRTDIYSLGVLLYELLVGALPLDTGSSRLAGLGDVQRVIREREPIRPSTRLSSLGEAAEMPARNRRSNPSTLQSQLRGDLDWIVLKCLAKDRDRRYATAAELADDINRHVRNEPVTAGPPGASYRTRKFLRRHRALAGGTAAVFLTLLAGVVSTTVFAVRESRQRIAAETQTEIAQAVNDFMNEMLASVDPKQAHGRDAGLLSEILAEAAANVETEFGGQPQVESSVRRTIGRTYMNLGLLVDAEVHLERSLELERSLQDGPRADLATTLHLLGALRYHQGRYEESEALLRQAVEIRHDVLGPERKHLAISLNQLAMLHLRTGRLEQAKTRLDEALAIVETAHERDTTLYLNITNSLAAYHGQRGEFAKAEAFVRDGLAAYADKPDDPDALVKMHNLATYLQQQGKLDEAERFFLEARERASHVFGPEHQFTLGVSNGLAALLERLGRHEEAEAVHREVLFARRRTLGETHPDVQSSLNNLGTVLNAQGKLDEAITVLREALELAERIRPPDHPLLALSRAQLAFVLRDAADPRNYAEAEQLAQSALAILDATLPPDHPFIANTLRGLRRLYDEQAMNDPVNRSAVQARLDALDDDTAAAP